MMMLMMMMYIQLSKETLKLAFLHTELYANILDLSLLHRVSFLFMMRNNDVEDVMNDIKVDDDLEDDDDVHINVKENILTVFSLQGFISLYEVRSERTS